MTSVLGNRFRPRLVGFLFAGCALLIASFWALELSWTLDEYDRQAEDLLDRHQQTLLDRKGEEFRDLFEGVFTSVRTISLLPMVRDVKGGNRRSEREDVVASGRFSVDSHRAMQQIYRSLHAHVKVSEIYYVLDGFDPARGEVPFLMYDEEIVNAHSGVVETPQGPVEGPAEIEDFEYAYFLKQLDWFRRNAPDFSAARVFDRIPVRLSPLMRTCDNTQYESEQQGNTRDTEGFIHAMPVYALGSNAFRGMVVTIIRANVLEARLVGVSVLPITAEDKLALAAAGETMPERLSTFHLRNAEYGIDIFDRRNTLIADRVAGKPAAGGRWKSASFDYLTGQPWTLSHYLTPDEVERVLQPITKASRAALIGRHVLLVVLASMLGLAYWLVKRSRRELVRMAHFDSLTELPNRRTFFARLDAAMSRGVRNKTGVGLFFIDIAGFNAVNDALGQQAGDQLLVAVAERLLNAVRASDTVAHGVLDKRFPDSVSRLGGDEFTILCEDLKGADDLAIVAERVMTAMKGPVELGHDQVEVSMYIGIAAYPEDAATGEKLLMSAENAMQECRRSGPGYLLFNEEMRKRAARQHHLMVELQFALERQQFVLFYQPKLRLRDNKVVSLEALIRWRHPELGVISPVEFIPLLERSGRIVEVGEWVLVQSCADLQRLDARGHSELRVSANVSVRQLRRGDFHQTVRQVIDSSGIDPDRLILEITESMVMENLDEGRLALDQLEALGVRLAIDDFGTGYSSLTYLQRLPFDYLKLDKSFIDAMTTERARHVVQSVIQLARGLNLETVAEGIETNEQRQELLDLGCDMIQGYLLSKPKPLDEIVDWLKRQS